MLDLRYNKIGDEGLRHLADALARGAAPALRWRIATRSRASDVALFGNPASDAAKRAVEFMVNHRCRPEQLLDGAFLVAHLADAKELRCSNLGWGDEEARRLAAALEHAHAQGALKAFEKLYLSDNEIGDEGVRHLGDALARGAAPKLKKLNLDGNPASAAAQQAVKDALKNRN